MVYLLYGDEPYIAYQTIKKAKESLSMPDMNLMEASGLGDSFFEFCQAVPFLEPKKVAVLSVSSLAEIDSERFYELVQMVNSTDSVCDIYITSTKVEKNRKAFKALQKAGALKECNKLSRGQLITFIRREFSEYELEKEAEASFVERLNYEDNDEVCLFTVVNEALKLKALMQASGTTVLTKELVEKATATNEVENVFALSTLIRSGNASGALHQLSLLERAKDFSEIATLSLVLKNIRVAIKRHLVKVADRTAFADLSLDTLRTMLDVTEKYIGYYKSGRKMDIRIPVGHLIHVIHGEGKGGDLCS